MKYYIALLGLTVLLGAGCAASPSPTSTSPTPTPTAPSDTTSTPSAPSNTISTTSTTPSPPTFTSSVTFMVDDTWKIYTNNALKFSFQWPTKGSYAPTWGVTFVKDDPCTDAQRHFDVSGVSFCHISQTEGAAGTQFFTDKFATKNGNQFVLISFEKKVYGGGLCSDGSLSSNNKTCARFSPADYQKMLETIVLTFKYTL